MKYRYTKFTGDALDELDLEDLVSKLSDLLLSSGFGNPHGHNDEERTMQALRDAILEALFTAGVLPEATIERLNRLYGSDKPVYEQFGLFLGYAIRLGFGRRVGTDRTVNESNGQQYPVTAQPGVQALHDAPATAPPRRARSTGACRRTRAARWGR